MRPASLHRALQLWPIVLGILLVVAVVMGGVFPRTAPRRAQAATTGDRMGGMSDAQMERWVRNWYALHPATPSAVTATAPVDSFTASGITFDADNNAATAIDSVRIFTGQSVLWKWLSGTHTTTNGNDLSDPNAAKLWDTNLTSATPTFLREFDQVGTFPFFCRIHVGFGMKGAVIVQPAAATYTAAGTVFDADGNAATQVDTVYIPPGQAVMFQWISGTHTVTSGTGSADPNVGVLFDVPLDSTSPIFTFTFNNLGTFPFFCRLHELNDMKGVVIVTNQLGVPAPPGGQGELGFAGPLEPSPARGPVAFRFALRQAGRVRADVFDATGRHVAAVLDGQFPAGIHDARWDGRDASGARAAAGVYYVRLSVPGFTGARRVVMLR